MRYLLDTNTLFWWLYKPHRLSATARAAITDPDNELLVSAISAFEMANKHRRGQWDEVAPLVKAFEEVVLSGGFVHLSLTARHAILAGTLPAESRDPFDRMIAAQAILERVPVLTVDAALEALGTETTW